MPGHSLLHYAGIELYVLLFMFLAAHWPWWRRSMAALEVYLAPLWQRPYLAFLALFALALLLRLCLIFVEPVPVPLFHDEFSYLLGADTFAHGRLTNPQPPVPLAFETIHVNMWPTYQSMYIPGTSLLLTLGHLLGMPWISVLVITALFPGVVYWMVSGWLPRGYAFAAGFSALVITESMNWWFDNYFCLALPAIGAALVLGSLPRIALLRNRASTWVLAIGLVLLVLTRPYEGFCVSFPAVMVLAWQSRVFGWRKLISLALVPTSALFVIFAWLFYYNWRGTGHPLLFPYMLNFIDYHITGPFLFSAVKPVPTYHNSMMRSFYVNAELPPHAFVVAHPVLFLLQKITVYYFSFLFGFGALLLIGVVFLVRHLREGLLLAPLLAFCGFATELVLMAWAPFPQYGAPASALFFLLVAFAIYAIRRFRQPWCNGLHLARGLVLAELLIAFNVLYLRVDHHLIPREPQYVSIDRASVAGYVRVQPGKQLCLVRYTPGHDGWQEWVFNHADIPNARVVWARSLSPEMDLQVIRAFPKRQVWLVRPDDADAMLSVYGTGHVIQLPFSRYRHAPR